MPCQTAPVGDLQPTDARTLFVRGPTLFNDSQYSTRAQRVLFDAMGTRRKVDLTEQLEAAVAGARAVLATKGMATGAQLGAPGVRPQVVQRLCSEGYEPTAKGVRVALDAQYLALMADGKPLPLTELKKRLKGASANDAKELVAELRRTSRAKVIVRGKQQCLVPAGERVIEGGTLKAIADHLKATTGWLAKVRSDKAGGAVLEADLLADLDALKALLQNTGPEQGVSLELALRGAILALRDEDSRLASIPQLSRRLRGRAAPKDVIEVLLLEYRRGKLELRPEGGLGRLSPEDRALCPKGAGGEPLSWVALLQE